MYPKKCSRRNERKKQYILLRQCSESKKWCPDSSGLVFETGTPENTMAKSDNNNNLIIIIIIITRVRTITVYTND